MKTKLINYILKYDTSTFFGLFSPQKYCSGNYVQRNYKHLNNGSIFNIDNQIDKKTNLPIFYKLDNIIKDSKNDNIHLFVNDGDQIIINSNYNKRIKIIID